MAEPSVQTLPTDTTSHMDVSDVTQSDQQPAVMVQEGEQQAGVEKVGEKPSENVDAELEAMKKRLQQMEQETLGVHGGEESMTPDGDGSGAPHAGAQGGPGYGVDEATAESDSRSIYVGNVDYSATGEELNQHFHECGTINRVTIMCHKGTGHPKGYAYIEFKDRESVQNALILNESMFRGRQLKVVEKRTNIPGLRGGMGGRSRGRFSRGGWRGGNYRGRPRGRGRGRGRGGYSPPF